MSFENAPSAIDGGCTIIASLSEGIPPETQLEDLTHIRTSERLFGSATRDVRSPSNLGIKWPDMLDRRQFADAPRPH
jgi:hypothetical protein